MTTHHPRRPRLPEPLPPACRDEGWETVRLRLPIAELGYAASVLEAYDNQFLIRTMDRTVGFAVVWYPRENRALLDEILLELSSEFPIEVLGHEPGMAGLDDVFPE